MLVDRRKPPEKMEAPKMERREPHSIRFKASEWTMFSDAASLNGLEVTRYVRECALTGHSFGQSQGAASRDRRVTA